MARRLPKTLKLNEADVTLKRGERKLLASIEPVTMNSKAKARVEAILAPRELVSRF
jgi:virulence-associated protein VagC